MSQDTRIDAKNLARLILEGCKPEVNLGLITANQCAEYLLRFPDLFPAETGARVEVSVEELAQALRTSYNRGLVTNWETSSMETRDKWRGIARTAIDFIDPRIQPPPVPEVETMFTGYDLRRCSDERIYRSVDELNRRLTALESAAQKAQP